MTESHPGPELANKVLDRIAAYARKRPGFLGRLAEELTRLSKGRRTWSVQQVGIWLTPNRDLRVEPSWGNGLMLEKAFENLKARGGRP